MIRTQISIDAETYRHAKVAAKRAGISLAEFIRRAVARTLGESNGNQQPWMKYAGAVASGDPDASRTVNDVYRRSRP